MWMNAGISVILVTLTMSGCSPDEEDSGGHGTAMAMSAVSATGHGLINVGGGVCLGIRSSSTLAGAFAVVGGCAETPTQTWHVHNHAVVGGELGWQLQNDVGKCLAVLGESTDGGAQVIQDDCSDPSNHSQIWRPERDVGGTLQGFTSTPGADEVEFWFRNGHSGLCLGLKGSSTSGGTPAVQGGCSLSDPSRTQQWDFAR